MVLEPDGILWFVVVTVFIPGVALLALAGSSFARPPGVDSGRLRDTTRRFGLAFVAATGVLCLYLLPVLTSGPRGGGLGSMGDPLGAFLMLGYVFVLAPFAVIASAILGILHVLRWRRAQRRD